MTATAVIVETGAHRTFASALDWPGWSRAGRGEEDALEALAAYLPRYATIAAAAGHSLPRPAAHFEVVERLAGSSTTDFGVPERAASAESEPLDKAGAARRAALVVASWRYLDEVVAGAPAVLRKGPRGGGRDRDAIAGHVRDAEVAYARKMGIAGATALARESPDTLRAAIAGVLAVPSEGGPLTERGWGARYGARRIAWHALDHAWEIEDRSSP